VANQIQAGTIMVHDSAMLQSLEVNGESYCPGWRSLGTLESSGFDHDVRAKGWSLFFMAGEIRALVPAWGGQNTLRPGVMRLMAQTRLQHFNCFEIRHVRKQHFLGIPYISIAAHPRHVQQGSQIRSLKQRALDAAPAQAEPLR
jgi:hypothetical protein